MLMQFVAHFEAVDVKQIKTFSFWLMAYSKQ